MESWQLPFFIHTSTINIKLSKAKAKNEGILTAHFPPSFLLCSVLSTSHMMMERILTKLSDDIIILLHGLENKAQGPTS